MQRTALTLATFGLVLCGVLVPPGSVAEAAAAGSADATVPAFSQGFAGGADSERPDGGLVLRGPVDPPTADQRDFNGLWKPGVTPRKRPPVLLDDAFLLEDPPLTPAAQAFIERVASIKRSGRLPSLSTHVCRSPGVYTTLFPAFVMAIIQTSSEMFILFEQPRLVRRIRIGGSHAEPLRPSYAGDSIGRWEGDTLVVESVGFNGVGELDISGAPVGPRARMIERYAKSADGRAIELAVTVEDPDNLREPLVVQRRWVTSFGVQQGEFDCEENPRADMDSDTEYLDPRLAPVCLRVAATDDSPSKIVCRATPR